MGAVYLARDERLGRDVALEVLPEGRVVDGRLVGLDPDDNPLVILGRTDRENVVIDLGTE